MLLVVLWLLGALAGRSLAQCLPPPEYIVNGTQVLDPPTSGDRIIPFPNSGDSYATTLMLADQPVFSGYFSWEPSDNLDCEVGQISTPVRASIIFGVTNNVN